jgi:hypothetical protein
MGKFSWTRSEARQANEESQQTQAASSAAEVSETGADRVTAYLSTPAAPAVEPVGSSVPPGGEIDFNRVGDHVGSILSAANEAALRIQEEAREEAKRIRAEAQKEATERLQAAREDAEAAMAEADRLRLEAAAWAEQARTSSDASAAERRAEAEAEAREIVAAAERQAASFSEDAEHRYNGLRMDISAAEERLRQLATGLHDLSAWVDTLVSGQLHARADGDDVADADELIDALGPARAAEEANR